MDEDMSDKFFLWADKEDEYISVNEEYGQLEGPMRKIPRTDNLFSARV